MKHLRVYDTETDKNSDSFSSAVSSLPVMIKVRNPLSVTYGRNYIENGLVFHLDGIDKGSTANAWTDLIGGHVFTNNGCTALENCWQITNTTSTYNSLRNTDTLSFPQTTHTIEVCYDSTKTVGLMFIPKDANNIAMGIVAQQRYIWNTTTTTEWHLPSGSVIGPHTISCNTQLGLFDKTLRMTNIGSNSWNRGTYNGIGARSNNATYSFNGKIYAIRIYNRLLSADEMRHNQMIDNKRFNLGL